ncbi:epoxide hydrolase family protein [Streptomyces sp. 4N509B]|uniref:epoxide hydrolase family protein n=1 Tax=Streptomyces sp. 4N509B TaxID=3457413 RepID=UPI003FD04DD7
MTPFRIAIPDQDLDDLRQRLRRTRWPEAETVADWSQGVPLDHLRALCDHWSEAYDWRAAEARINRLPQFRTTIDGLDLHFVHVRSPRPDSFPVILTHGWPSSFLEFERVVGPLTDPAAHGHPAADAFHVVCPSLPGYGFSQRPAEPGWNIRRVAAAWAQLMGRLGYRRYGAQGGDWGALVTTELARLAPDQVAGIHCAAPPVVPDPAALAGAGPGAGPGAGAGAGAGAGDRDRHRDLTRREREAVEALEEFTSRGSGYAAQMSTRPQTLGYGLVDSPAGLCAWLAEKYHAWTDRGSLPGNAVDRDTLLDTVTLYWLTATAASAARLYWEHAASLAASGPWLAEPVSTPMGGSIFPADMLRPTREWAEKSFTDIRHWNELDRGGHFPALEQPDLFVTEVRAFFRHVR